MIEKQYRIGIGHDTHRLEPGGPLRIGGIDIESTHHAVGHSDADVLLHAITDALLGAVALGDIGDMFPDTDPANKGRDSVEMVQLACDRVNQLGYKVVNIDCIVFVEKPNLSNKKREIANRVASALGMDELNVSLKAKTGEGVGSIGTQAAIAAQCVALVYREVGTKMGF